MKLIPYDIIINIANNLGCNFKEPIMEENKYTIIINKGGKRDIESIDPELLDKEMKEYERINKEYKNKWNRYINSVLNWLVDNNYMMELD